MEGLGADVVVKRNDEISTEEVAQFAHKTEKPAKLKD